MDERMELYKVYRGELNSSRQSNIDELDKAILTLSSGGLGFSLAFLKDIVPLAQTFFLPLLYCSWALFLAAIVFTVLSFGTHRRALDLQLSIADEYFLVQNEKAYDSPNKWAKLTSGLSVTSVATFILAIALTVLFVSVNIAQKKIEASKEFVSVSGAGAPLPLTKGGPPRMPRYPTAPKTPELDQNAPAQPTTDVPTPVVPGPTPVDQQKKK
jgi:hypothetical protein